MKSFQNKKTKHRTPLLVTSLFVTPMFVTPLLVSIVTTLILATNVSISFASSSDIWYANAVIANNSYSSSQNSFAIQVGKTIATTSSTSISLGTGFERVSIIGIYSIQFNTELRYQFPTGNSSPAPFLFAAPGIFYAFAPAGALTGSSNFLDDFEISRQPLGESANLPTSDGIGLSFALGLGVVKKINQKLSGEISLRGRFQYLPAVLARDLVAYDIRIGALRVRQVSQIPTNRSISSLAMALGIRF